MNSPEMVLFGYHKSGLQMFGIALALLMAGCGSNPHAAVDPTRQGQILFGGTGSGDTQDTDSWSIVLRAVAGNDRASIAAESADRYRQMSSRLRDVFIEARGSRTLVLIGRHSSPSSKEALRLLESVRSISEGGERPFQYAFFVPPAGAEVGELDLRTAREAFDADYTLQIGVYGRLDSKAPSEKELAEFRANAEAAARDLRTQGELAFYYHGPSLSMVTVGAMRQEDVELNPSIVPALQERFPHNLFNGQGIRETVKTESGIQKIMQPSALVAIPE